MAIDRARSFPIVVQKSQHPLPGWGLRRALVQCSLYFLDGVLVASYFVQMLDARGHRMSMRVVEAWKDALESQVNLARARGCQRQHILVCYYRHKSPANDGHRLCSWLTFIHRPDVSVIQNSLRLFRAQEWQRQQAAHTLHKIPSRNWSHRYTSQN